MNITGCMPRSTRPPARRSGGSCPAYSPELTPVEQLWEDVQSRIDRLEGQVRSSLTARQEHVAGIIRRYTAETIASLTGYAYLVDAISAL
jgi:putative transposase